MSKPEFKANEFYAALERVRLVRRLNWKQVAEQSGVSASTLTRIAQGKRPDVDSLAALVNWSGLSADAFVARADQVGKRVQPLSDIANVLYSDSTLSEDGRATMMDLITAAYLRLSKNN
ncbi:helix-turn-helix domain-containing protein [Mesorhizobium sp. M2A.F.Ca.ET.037.01.1.1]|uniref:helix-turn-helix domain-containing protein n=1 Tax=unclassified Mesorhizobium TaxID=325217 RepID=UPI000F759452|nr:MULTISPECIES: helix-turn-helix domain-containing protein [unclassified Mesorhizobium]RUY13115.1 helix-turn-helix domain-containing protein [Mesorhizobium sp. M2A.F.Ca.ET.040.01.1.1]AZO16053.1 XRE family transcriptional regulator [Mesorhizobium sp. M2A.F.Ca.ET.043.05.1.1]RUX23394.1 helix-turn-helix domain-containing protein [Mesorhizobium sp. M2A.F.Ca.ET.037.01.1.1]RWA89219.1 MAG: helix-turn-helix domain-containing protein [Mesorhizobium sp.]RWE85344.1 MAG: helix-turn-helix domain-containing